MSKTERLGIFCILMHAFLDILFFSTCKLSYETKRVSSDILGEVEFVFSYNLKSFILILLIVIFRVCIKKASNTKKMFPHISFKIFILYLTMSFFSVCGFVIFLYGLQSMKLANAMSLKYTEQVLWIISGVMLMKEKLSYYQWKYMAISVLGIVFIMLSTKIVSNISTYYFPIFSAVCWTISSQIGKLLVLRKTDILNHLFLYYGFHCVIITYLSLYLGIVDQNWSIKHIYLSSYEFLIQFFAMVFFYKAMQCCYISLLAPFVYIKLVIAAFIGFLLFNEQPNFIEIISYCFIIFAGIKLFNNKNTIVQQY